MRSNPVTFFISDDNGDSWQQIYLTAPLNTSGASDGFRRIDKVSDTEAVISVSPLHSGMRLSLNGNHYAEVIVDVPEGAQSLTVESGYLCANRTKIYNSHHAPGAMADLDFGGYGIVKDRVSGKTFRLESPAYVYKGKTLSHFELAPGMALSCQVSGWFWFSTGI